MKLIKVAQPEEVPSDILYQGDEHPEITGYVHPEQDLFRVPIKDGDQVVGFFTPRKDGDEWRVGAIFVLPEHRGKGLAGKAIKDFFSGDKLPAYAHVGLDNPSSQKAFERAGFIPEGQPQQSQNDPTWTYQKWVKTR
jgi:RimJ/RimL family protein N-acetyltransferase